MALREVSLIPADILKRRFIRRHLSFWAVCLVICLTLIGGFYIYQTRTVLAKNPALSALKDVHTGLGSTIEEIKWIQTELEGLEERQLVLETIIKRQSYSAVLLNLSELMNQSTWLTQLTIKNVQMEEEKGSRPILTLTGMSFSNDALGDFINKLSNEPLFTTVILNYARETVTSLSEDRGPVVPIKAIQFQITCDVSPG